MQVKCVNSLLNNLVLLTNERDEIALESALVQTLTDVLTTIHGDKAKPAIIFYLKDEESQLLTAVSAHGAVDTSTIPHELKLAIIDCYKSGEIGAHGPDDDAVTKLYTLKNMHGYVTGIIGIEDPLIDARLDDTICMLLKIYQNFTNLINDNESDTLTGLLNRKTFDQRITKILSKTQAVAKRKEDKKNQSYFLAIFDIDHFKRVNDEFGHLIGDEVLLMFSQLMQQSFRETDPLFRFGGEEFVGIFECTNPTDINMVLERFRQKVESFAFPQVGKITVSSGYTEILEFNTPSQIIDRADSALYFAKNNGRNRTCYYEELIRQGLLEESDKQGDIEFF